MLKHDNFKISLLHYSHSITINAKVILPIYSEVDKYSAISKNLQKHLILLKIHVKIEKYLS